MELEDYIKQSYLRPNKTILEDLGADEELIDYLTNTPNNTNINVWQHLIKNDSKEGLIIYYGHNEETNGIDLKRSGVNSLAEIVEYCNNHYELTAWGSKKTIGVELRWPNEDVFATYATYEPSWDGWVFSNQDDYTYITTKKAYHGSWD